MEGMLYIIKSNWEQWKCIKRLYICISKDIKIEGWELIGPIVAYQISTTDLTIHVITTS